jgi:hypothetical protein
MCSSWQGSPQLKRQRELAFLPVVALGGEVEASEKDKKLESLLDKMRTGSTTFLFKSQPHTTTVPF